MRGSEPFGSRGGANGGGRSDRAGLRGGGGGNRAAGCRRTDDEAVDGINRMDDETRDSRREVSTIDNLGDGPAVGFE